MVFRGMGAGCYSTGSATDQLKEVRSRVAKTYGWVAYNVGATGAFGSLAYDYGGAAKVLEFMGEHHPLITCGAFCAVTLTPMVMTIWTNDQEHPILKKVFLTTSSLMMGTVLSPLGFLGSGWILPTTVFSAGLTASLAIGARMAKTDWHLKYAYPLRTGLAATVAASVGALVITSDFASALHATSLYVGLGVFTAHMIADVQEMYESAEQDEDYSPINHSLLIFTNGLNLWIRIGELWEKYQAPPMKRVSLEEKPSIKIESTSKEHHDSQTYGGGGGKSHGGCRDDHENTHTDHGGSDSFDSTND